MRCIAKWGEKIRENTLKIFPLQHLVLCTQVYVYYVGIYEYEGDKYSWNTRSSLHWFTIRIYHWHVSVFDSNNNGFGYVLCKREHRIMRRRRRRRRHGLCECFWRAKKCDAISLSIKVNANNADNTVKENLNIRFALQMRKRAHPMLNNQQIRMHLVGCNLSIQYIYVYVYIRRYVKLMLIHMSITWSPHIVIPVIILGNSIICSVEAYYVITNMYIDWFTHTTMEFKYDSNFIIIIF